MAATISKGTLNLRFMQNARRAEQELEVESAETIVAKDDSCWEVSREVKNMWGITSEPSSSSLVTHEASYLPFVLSGADASGSPAQLVKLRGRRTWNKRGQEVTEEVELPLDDNNNSTRGSSSVARQNVHLHGHPTKTEHHLASKRLTSISSFGPGSSSTKETKRPKSRNAKSARELIHEAPSGLREIKITTTNNTSAPPSPAPSPSKSKMIKIDIDTAGSPPPAPLKFLKPAGVDDPSDDVARRDGSRPAQQRDANADGNWGTRSQNLKREREDRDEPTTTAGAPTADRQKRKKSGAAAVATAP